MGIELLGAWSQKTMSKVSVILEKSFLWPAITCAILAVALLASPASARYASLVIDEESGQVLHAANADTRRYPASLTKVMTLYMTFEALKSGQLSMDSKLPVSARAAGMPPSKLGLRQGEHIAVRDAVLALVTRSANDAAVVVAEALAGTEINFAREMTKRAHALGMTNTTFRNASGLPNNGQISTARDMATLARRIRADHPEYMHLFTQQSFTYKGRTHRNHNNLLSRYAGTDGLKTGYINASGFNLVTTVERDGRRLIGVVFGGRTAQSRDQHMVKLLDTSFERAIALAVRPPMRPTADMPKRFETVTAQVDNPFGNAEADALDQGSGQTTAATPAPTRHRDRADNRNWGVQVGAFSNPARARLAAHQAQRHIRSAESLPMIALVPTDQGRTLIRARLLGLTEAGARRACTTLQAQNIACVVVPPSDSDRLAQSS